MTDDTINVGTALRLTTGDSPMACCPKDDEPLIFTTRFRGAEFYCVACEATYGFLAPKPVEWTEELQKRHDDLKAVFDTRFRSTPSGGTDA